MTEGYEVKRVVIRNTNKFRQAAIHFETYGYYTAAPKGTTAYMNYWQEEREKCLNGCIIEDDYITGYFYFYLNYCQIIKTIKNPETGKSRRVKGFPDYYDYDKAYYDYIEACEQGNRHAVVIKARRKGFSFKGAGMLCRNFYLIPNSKSYAVASDLAFLTKDGLLTKAWGFMSFIDEHTAWAKKRQKIDSKIHKRASLIIDIDGVKTEVGYMSEIIGISLSNDADKIRGISGKLILFEESGKFSNLLDAWQIARPSVEDVDGTAYGLLLAYGCVCKGTKIFTNKGDLIKIEDLRKKDGVIGYNTYSPIQQKIEHFREPYKTECYKITTNSGKILECSFDHPIIYSHRKLNKRVPGRRLYNEKIKSWEWKKAENFKVGDQVGVIEEIPFFGKEELWNPRLIGWLIGDGTYGYDKTPRLANCDEEINNYINDNFNTVIEKQYTTKDGKQYKETRIKDICYRLRDLGIYGQVKDKKRLPRIIFQATKKDVCELIGGIFDTDGYVTLPKNKTLHRIVLTGAYKDLLLDVLFLLQKLGIHGKVAKIKASNRIRMYKDKLIKDSSDYYRLCINDVKSLSVFANTITLFPKHKNERLQTYKTILEKFTSETSKYIHGLRFERVVSVENIGQQLVYNLMVSESHTYIANGIVTHNTGGEADADYQGLKYLFYEPDVYKCLPVKNIWDEGATKPCGFFVPHYYNMSPLYMDEDGNSLVIEALKFSLQERDHIIKNSTNRQSVDRYITERPHTPAEATLQLSGNIFPKTELNKHLSFIRVNKAVQEFKQVGELYFDNNGILKWEQAKIPTDITSYRIGKGMDTKGSIVIWEHPEENPPYCLYIAGCDPYDFDKSGTNSLGSVFIYKRFQSFDKYYETLVAEYTGRPETAEEFYENVRKLLIYYNAICLYENEKKGIFQYFAKMHCEHLLADQPSIIKDIVKDSIVHRGKGIHATKGIQDWAEGKIKEWLVEDRGDGQLGLHTILSEPLLEELISFNDDGNFDRVIALSMIMVYREELHNIQVKKRVKQTYTNRLFPEGIFVEQAYHFI